MNLNPLTVSQANQRIHHQSLAEMRLLCTYRADGEIFDLGSFPGARMMHQNMGRQAKLLYLDRPPGEGWLGLDTGHFHAFVIPITGNLILRDATWVRHRAYVGKSCFLLSPGKYAILRQQPGSESLTFAVIRYTENDALHWVRHGFFRVRGKGKLLGMAEECAVTTKRDLLLDPHFTLLHLLYVNLHLEPTWSLMTFLLQWPLRGYPDLLEGSPITGSADFLLVPQYLKSVWRGKGGRTLPKNEIGMQLREHNLRRLIPSNTSLQQIVNA